jgi:cytochrome c553
MEVSMTTIRSVYATFAFAVAVALVLAACGASGPTPGTPEALYADLGCAKCHGANREGQRSGPPLIGLADHWQEESLLEYLRSPKTFVQSNPRLSYLDEQYPIAMPAYGTTDEEDLRKLADFILNS